MMTTCILIQPKTEFKILSTILVDLILLSYIYFEKLNNSEFNAIEYNRCCSPT